jgi:outer membrane biosynthesis protein TonB
MSWMRKADAETTRWRLGAAFVVALLLHTAGYGAWRWGQSHRWPQNRWSQWMQRAVASLLPTPQSRPLTQAQKKPAESLTFVDVDKISLVPPQEAKFYGAANSVAANPDPKAGLEMPEVKGTQQRIVKTTDNSTSKAQPLQPTPPPPKPVPPTETTERKAAPKEAVPMKPLGDLAMARPVEQSKPAPVKSNESDTGDAEKAHTRPRKLSEVPRSNMAGERMRQEGGVKRVDMNSSLDVKGSLAGEYDAEFIAAVQQRWFSLLEGRNVREAGKVVLEFKLHQDGRISEMKVAESTVNELQSYLCQKAILDPAPFRKWPVEMRRELPGDVREVRFTFFYD